MNKLKVAVIGVGHLGKEHARIYSGMPDVCLEGVVDTDMCRARKIAAMYNTKAFACVNDIVDRIDAASVVVPTEAHFKIGKELLKKGRPILVEKPVAPTVYLAQKLVYMAGEKKVLFQAGHVERFNPAVRRLAKLVKNPRFIEIHRLSPFTKRGTDVGAVLDLMIHDIDIILALVNDKIKTVDAVGADVLTRHEDIANARIMFRNGCAANLTVSRVSPERMRKIRVFQKNAYISVDYYRQEGVRYYKEGGNILKESLQVDKDEPLKLELEDFVHSVLTGKKPLVGGDAALSVLMLAKRIEKKIWNWL